MEPSLFFGEGALWFWGVQVALHLLSWFYNWLIERLHEREWMHNWTWLTVVVGVAYTLIGAAVAMWNTETTANTAVLGVVITFVSTGIPMSVGDIWRVLRWQKNGGDAVGGVIPSTGDKGKTHGEESSSDGTSQPK